MQIQIDEQQRHVEDRLRFPPKALELIKVRPVAFEHLINNVHGVVSVRVRVSALAECLPWQLVSTAAVLTRSAACGTGCARGTVARMVACGTHRVADSPQNRLELG